jgi:hypothetical protein
VILRVVTVLAGISLAGAARADDLPPITSRDYAIDLYGGAALGSVRVVGMGGAAIAGAEGAPGAVANPAAAAVRPATSTTHWDWDWTFDAQSAVYASDLDNNGRKTDNAARLATFGLLGNWGEWAVGITGISQSAAIQVPDMDPGKPPQPFEATATRGRVEFAKSFAQDEYTIGLSVEGASFSFTQGAGGASNRLFEISGSGFGIGGVWKPPRGDLRLGAIASTAVKGSQVDASTCDPNACNGHVLPMRVEAPWQVGVGMAYRWADTGWNQWIAGLFRDEHAVMIAADVLISGPVADGYGLEAFGENLAQRSGAKTVVSVRGGVEWELLPGHIRARGGSYWEPGRFEGVGGRAHFTAGLELGALEVTLMGRRRMRISFTADVAPRYGTATISLGFWH